MDRERLKTLAGLEEAKESSLWGRERVSGVWRHLRGVTPETADQWFAIFSKDPDDRKKYDHLMVARTKAPVDR